MIPTAFLPRLSVSLLAVLLTPIAAAQVASTPEAPDYDRGAYRSCLDRLGQHASSAGIETPVFDRHVRSVVPDTSVLKLLDNQPEFKTPIWDYLAGLVDEERVEDGKAMLERHADTLARVEKSYGVDPATVVAVWGVESDFGKVFGKRPLLESLTTLSCMGRRQEFFRGELIDTLRIIQAGDVPAERLVGSWAGAFGHTQFMPSTYRRIAVDFDGDGRRDLVDSVPDALASTANYLKRSGWRSGQPWGHEVRLPAGFDTAVSGRTSRRPLSYWVERGIKRVDGLPLEGSSTPTALLLPAGKDGPAFLVFKNFDAIYSYNAAMSYALAISLLSDRLRGSDGLGAGWPTPDPGLSRRERRELQELLLARGHDIGEVDGIIGSASRAAIVAEQRKLGLEPDGRAGRNVLAALRNARPPAGAGTPR
ncbi:lytic murein transglycosylase [Novilysobacter spongiicola]|uniref:Lytic murein transglycosylase n=1 Tax=Lysobacter spongiicola DSM 21749 TaxID=1122188 RepID=A0A1T4LRT9_9GAMM|nr:lytic murein transglycosylase [Lysobacter spongiicola]SJZ57452.1 lytic murein transglycosylase [Lysobacter spongiicola DSM 21749]